MVRPSPSEQLESVVRRRCASLGVSDSITPYVLAELRRLDEAKSLGTFGDWRGGKGKRGDIITAQALPAAKQRGHAKAAGNALDKLVDQIADHFVSLINQYRSNEISQRRLNTRASIAFKENTREIFKLGMKAAGLVKPTGELYDLSSSEEKWLGTYVKQELGYFKKFLDDVSSRDFPEKEVERRSRNYAESLRSVYQAGRVLAVGKDVLIHWVLESRNPCTDCRLLAQYSPYTSDLLPCTPKSGTTRCRQNCYCVLNVEKASRDEIRRAQQKSKSVSSILNQIKNNQKKK